MKRMANFIGDLIGIHALRQRGSRSAGELMITRSLTKAFINCPICEGEFVDHYFTLLAVTPMNELERASDLLSKIKNHRWEEAFQVKEFDSLRDALVVYCLRCPGRILAIVVMRDPYEPYHNPSVLDHEVLDTAKSEELRSVLRQSRWLPIE